MKRICFLQYELCGGGAERKVCTLANFFVSKGYHVEICLFGRNIVEYQLDDRIRMTFIDRSKYTTQGNINDTLYYLGRFLVSTIAKLGAISEKLLLKMGIIDKEIQIEKKIWNRFNKYNNYTAPLKKYIKHHKNDVFITMMINTFLGVVDSVGDKVVVGKRKLKYIVMDCNNPKMNATPEMDKRRNYYFSRITRSAVMTEGAKSYYPQEVQKNMIVIPNPVRPDLPEPYDGERRKVVVNYCRLNKQKDIPCLIDAFKQFHKKYMDYELKIYGKGELKDSLLEKIKHDGLDDCVHIYDFCANVHQEIKDAAMFVSSSLWEGFGNSILEALSIGLPVISTDCEFGPSDLIQDHVNGILVPMLTEDKANSLCSAMTELASDPKLCERLSRESVKTRQTYDAQIIGEKWIALIDSI